MKFVLSIYAAVVLMSTSFGTTEAILGSLLDTVETMIGLTEEEKCMRTIELVESPPQFIEKDSLLHEAFCFVYGLRSRYTACKYKELEKKMNKEQAERKKQRVEDILNEMDELEQTRGQGALITESQAKLYKWMEVKFKEELRSTGNTKKKTCPRFSKKKFFGTEDWKVFTDTVQDFLKEKVDLKTVKLAYKTMALMYHPDKSDCFDYANEAMTLVNAYYQKYKQYLK